MNRIKAFCCWSGGKESVLSLYRAKNSGMDIVCLLNMISDDGKQSRTHGISSELLRLQAQAIGIPIIQKRTSWQDYEDTFKRAVLELKNQDINTGIFGDIDMQEHRDWVERVCKDVGIKPILPLWQGERESLLQEFISLGFKAVVVCTQASHLGSEWLGKKIDHTFFTRLKDNSNVDLCGEKGEYHSFIYDGPMFKESVGFTMERKVLKNEHWFLEILPEEN